MSGDLLQDAAGGELVPGQAQQDARIQLAVSHHALEGLLVLEDLLGEVAQQLAAGGAQGGDAVRDIHVQVEAPQVLEGAPLDLQVQDAGIPEDLDGGLHALEQLQQAQGQTLGKLGVVDQGLGHQGIPGPGGVGAQELGPLFVEGRQGGGQQAGGEGGILKGQEEHLVVRVLEDLAELLILGGLGGQEDSLFHGGPAALGAAALQVGGHARALAHQPVVEVLHHPQQLGVLALGPEGDVLVFAFVELGEEAHAAAEVRAFRGPRIQGRHQQPGQGHAAGEVGGAAGGSVQALADGLAEVPAGLAVDLLKEGRHFALGQGPADEILGDHGVLKGRLAQFGIWIHQESEQLLGLGGLLGPGQSAGPVQGLDLGLRRGRGGQGRERLPVRVVRR